MRRQLAVTTTVALALLLAGCGAGATDTASDPSQAPVGSATDEAAADPTAAAKTTSEPAEPKRAKAKATTEPEPAAAAPQPAAGRYVSYADYSTAPGSFAGTDVVLFFHAAWCPKCQETERSINDDGVPAGLTVVKVDFDSSTELRQEYGVTLQHTYVQVDAAGNALTKWTGSYGDTSVAGIAANTV